MHYFYLLILLLPVSDSLWWIWNKTTSQVTNFSTLCLKTFYSPHLYTSLLIPRKKKNYVYKIQISNVSPLNTSNPFFCFLFSVLSHSPKSATNLLLSSLCLPIFLPKFFPTSHPFNKEIDAIVGNPSALIFECMPFSESASAISSSYKGKSNPTLIWG